MLHPKYPVIKFKIKYTLGVEFLSRSCDGAQEGQFRTVPVLFWVPFDETLRQGWAYKSFPGQVVPGTGEMRQNGKGSQQGVWHQAGFWCGQLEVSSAGELWDPVENMPWSYPTGEAMKLEHLPTTNSYQLFVGCFWGCELLGTSGLPCPLALPLPVAIGGEF